MRTTRGFTLVELLLVVAIIATLISMLLPAANVFYRQAHMTECIGHLKSIHSVFGNYLVHSNGKYPSCDTLNGDSFDALVLTDDRRSVYTGGEPSIERATDALSQWRLLKQSGAEQDMFWCPFDYRYRDYDYESVASWTEPIVEQRGGGWVAGIQIGYVLLFNRDEDDNGVGVVGDGAVFTDGRPVVQTDAYRDNLPIVADMLYADLGGSNPKGWHHGGGVEDSDEGLYNSSCNTLFKSGQVTRMPWESLEAQGPGLEMAGGEYYFWLGRGVEDQ